MLRWVQQAYRYFVPPPVMPPRLPAPEKPVVPLARVFPPLPARDMHLSLERENRFSEEDISSALELLRGGLGRERTRVTRPARFQIALRQLKGFAGDCLMVQSGSKVALQDMYAGYLLWAADNSQTPIPNSDFDFAMSDYLSSVGGIRTAKSYDGCRFRQDFVRRLDEMNGPEVQRRLGAGREQLLAYKQTGDES